MHHYYPNECITIEGQSPMTAVAIAEISVIDRHRTNLGDLDSLAKSMKELGQLQPVVVTTELRLVAGGRRLEAAKSLGWTEIEANIVDNLSAATDLLRAERDENTCRQAFRPTEEHSLYQALLALEAQAMSRGTDAVPAPTAKARASIAEIVTGNPGRHKTLERIGEVKDLAGDAAPSERVREAAREALVEIDRTGSVTNAYKRVKLAEKAAIAAQKSAFEDWSTEELRLRDDLKAGKTVVVSYRDNHSHIVTWATAQGLLEPIDRRSEWGNPFELPYDGDRETVVANYADHYLPHKPSLLSRLGELRGKALACWCAPDACHGDVLKARAEEI